MEFSTAFLSNYHTISNFFFSFKFKLLFLLKNAVPIKSLNIYKLKGILSIKNQFDLFLYM